MLLYVEIRSKIKKTKYKEFAQSINFNTDTRYVWNTLNILKDKWVRINSTHTTENLQMNNQIEAFNKICPPWVSTDRHQFPECKINPFLESDFTFTEFKLAVNSRKKQSSPGIDGVDYTVIKNLL